MMKFKKIVKFIGLGIVIIALGIYLLYLYMDNKKDIGKNYRDSIKTNGQIEEKYLKSGSFEVTKDVIKAEDPIKKYSIFYPKELTNTNKKYPVIFVVNGTGGKTTKYEPLFEQYASWGFIVVGTEDKNTGTGLTTMKAYDYLILQNDAKDSKFFNKIDKDNIGITGFSQGGAAVMNVITNPTYKKYFKTAVPLSPVSEKTTREMTNYNYDSSKIEIPTFVLSGTEGDFEIKTVIPIEELNIIFDKIPKNKIVARRVGMDHEKMMYQASGYVTAWFTWQLQGNQEAAKAFMGNDAEILKNTMYQDIKIKLGE